MTTTKNALLEIGTEEIPASYIEPARKQLAALAEEFLTSHRLQFGKIAAYATPRRLTLFVEKLADKSEDRVEEIMGPAVKVGKDAQGNFTMAAKGFAARHSIAPEKLAVKATDKGEYFCVQKKTPGEKTDKLLKEMFPSLVGRIYFPKTMRWEASGFRFARPLRVLLALDGDKIVKFELAGVKAGNWTYGLHTLSNKKVSVHTPERYLPTLQNNCVIVDQEERKEVLRKVIESTGKRAKGAAIPDEALIEEVNYLVEHPVAVLGSFEEKYLRLPPEVLITCMRKKQKYFPVQDDKGKLTNHFIGIRNGISENQDIVREGYERVLTARLADAEFFFNNDMKTPLASRVEKLKGVVFQEKLGTMYEKMARVKELAVFINELLPQNEQAPLDHLMKAAELAKADLVTEMVFEYPELQGVVGRIYAERSGEPSDVARAIEEHYWPLSAEGKLPQAKTAVVLALADKIDTLVGDFAIGLIPTGSADPYGLRRAAVGVIRIILERNLPLSLQAVFQKSLSLLPPQVPKDPATVGQVMDFMRQRMENIFQTQGYKIDEIRAVMAAGFDSIVDVKRRLEAVKQIRTQPDFEPLAGAFKRAANILKQAEKMKITVPAGVREDLLSEEAEKNLYSVLRQIESDVRSFIDKGDYSAALQKMVNIKQNVDAFFDKTMVMAEDVNLRANRLALLKYLTSLFFRILDLSLLQG